MKYSSFCSLILRVLCYTNNFIHIFGMSQVQLGLVSRCPQKHDTNGSAIHFNAGRPYGLALLQYSLRKSRIEVYYENVTNSELNIRTSHLWSYKSNPRKQKVLYCQNNELYDHNTFLRCILTFCKEKLETQRYDAFICLTLAAVVHHQFCKTSSRSVSTKTGENGIALPRWIWWCHTFFIEGKLVWVDYVRWKLTKSDGCQTKATGSPQSPRNCCHNFCLSKMNAKGIASAAVKQIFIYRCVVLNCK